ncbi:ABC transporter permease [Clostridiaceae bacterium 68-1-5]|uniref:ABC transporter permease n=1 Tax=Suipraeoptans intestinalis TaxID=2606628 RepID=A0A6N7USS6_9FIRM|nr:ABC transporter permease [Suipraeoptans intestinalis]MSR94223.1 ABC transporter permease [Suipraeoptans intestinalis]
MKKTDHNIQRLLILLLAFAVLAGVTKTSEFMKIGNFQTMAKQLSEYGLMAVGVGICMISGGIDLSTVYIANLCGIIAGLLMQKNTTPMVAILVAVAVGLACGAFNGYLVSYLKIPAMLATLGTYQLFMGLAIIASGGSTVSGIPDSYTSFATTALFGYIPLSFVVFMIAVALTSFLMGRTKFGTRIYLVGTNQKAARFSGIHCNLTLIRAYMLSGLLSAVAGLLSLARINSAKADFGSSYTMQCILIAVLGGVNPNGGFGTVPGIAIAVVILQMMSSYLNMFPSISNYYRDLIWGVALVGLLIINFALDKRKIKKLSKISN